SASASPLRYQRCKPPTEDCCECHLVKQIHSEVHGWHFRPSGHIRLQLSPLGIRRNASYVYVYTNHMDAAVGVSYHETEPSTRRCYCSHRHSGIRRPTMGRGCLLEICESRSPGAQLERNGSLQDQLYS